MKRGLTRRALLTVFGGCVAFRVRPARATVLRGLSLAALAEHSDHIVIARAVDAVSRFVTLGGSRRIVTDVRVQLSDVIAKRSPSSQLVVRVLGGRVGHSAELVEGQAELALDAPCVLFLRAATVDLHWVNGMAQGHYPLETHEGATYLVQSPRLPDLLNEAHSAVASLVGQELGAARALVRGALAP